MTATTVPGLVLRFLARLRFPVLFVVTVVLFSIDLLVPDVIPFVDEILLGLAAVLFGKLKRRRAADDDGRPGRAGRT